MVKPAFRITVSGSDITQLVADRLISLSVTDEAGVKSDRVEIALDDRDQRLSIPSKKAVISVALGYTDRLVDKGQYVVEEVEIEGPDRRMIIRANAAGATKGAGAAREKSWHDTTIGDIARSIASRRGWTPAISRDLDGVKVAHIDQRENDLQFLVRLAMDNGAVAKVAHGRLIIAPHGEGKTVSGKALPAIKLAATETSDWVYTSADRGDYSGVKASYNDVKAGRRGEVLQGSDDDNTHTLMQTYSTKEAAERAAKSKFKSLRSGRDKFQITNAPGIPEIEAETKIDATGFRKGVDGEWAVVSVVHKITDAGYTCSITCETPAQ